MRSIRKPVSPFRSRRFAGPMERFSAQCCCCRAPVARAGLRPGTARPAAGDRGLPAHHRRHHTGHAEAALDHRSPLLPVSRPDAVHGGRGVTLGKATCPTARSITTNIWARWRSTTTASMPRCPTPGAGTQRLQLSVRYQGCHEVDPKICYPPYTEKLDLPLPAGSDRAAAPRHGATRSAPRSAARAAGPRAGWRRRAARRAGVPLEALAQPRTSCCCAGRCRRTITCIATRPRSRSPMRSASG